ncbi:MAG: InlB B-repeat-containing protein, partial [Planctomycetota bacterium]
PVTDTKVPITKPRVNLGAAVAAAGLSFGAAIHVEEGCTLNGWVAPDTNNYPGWDANTWDPNSFVIEEDPNFIHGYYLSQFTAGQVTESNCVNGGSTWATDVFDMNAFNYTTRVDGVNDIDMVDMGYHYTEAVIKYELTVIIPDDPNDPGIHGTVDFDPVPVEPNGWYYEGTQVTLTSMPDPGYYVRGWYDVNDVLLSTAKTYDVVMDANQTVIIRYRRPVTTGVSGGGDAIQQAVNLAENGDTLHVAAGTYSGDIDFQGKEIRLFGDNPDDPNIAAQVIIDCQNSVRAFTFDNGEDVNTVVDGFTIINGGPFGQAGGAIYIGSECSPTIVNIVISDCAVTFDNGGSIYIGSGSSPTINNVSISNSTAFLGNGGAIYVGMNSSPVFIDCDIVDSSVL